MQHEAGKTDRRLHARTQLDHKEMQRRWDLAFNQAPAEPVKPEGPPLTRRLLSIFFPTLRSW